MSSTGQPPPEKVRPRALSAGHFRCVAQGGFGDGNNAYAYSCAWFKGHVYIGANRYVLPLIFKQATWPVLLNPPPVPIPDYMDMDFRGQIWRYKPGAPEWERVYRAPWIEGLARNVALCISYRCMVVFQGKSDSEPTLYTLPLQGREAPRRVILRSQDGVNFEELPPPLLPGEAPWRSFRGVVPFKGRLFAAPSSGQINYQKGSADNIETAMATEPNTAAGSFVRCTADPASGIWEASSLPDMGDPSNRSIMDMGVCGNHLYVGTLNIREGFQLWRTEGEGPGPHRWEKVLDRGGDRGPLNQAILSFAEFQGDLYMGTCIQNGGHDKHNNIGPAAGEVLRLHPDLSWDLVMGEPRRTRQGFKAPLSGQGPGFSNPFSGYIWRMTAHDGALYVSTGELTAVIHQTDRTRWPKVAQRVFDEEAIDRFLKMRGGAELWRTTNGEDWFPVTVNGFGNLYNGGIRSILSTPHGLFIGTANAFGPKVAVRGPGGWRYVDNPRGGVEVWHGSLDHGGLAELDRPQPPEPVSARPAKADPDGVNVTHSMAPIEEVLWDACQLDPFVRLAQADKDLQPSASDAQEEVMRYFGGGDVRNVGYWSREDLSPREASLALVEELAAFMPDPPEQGTLAVLVLGRAAGGIAAELLRLRDKLALTVCVSDAAEARAARAREPRAEVVRRRGGLPPKGRADFDVALWIEGPGEGGRDRDRALAEARRALRPGGRLIAAELVAIADGASPGADYERDLARAGFVEVKVLDVTDKTWRRFLDHSRRFVFVKEQFLQIDADRSMEVLRLLPGGEAPPSSYLIVSAEAPR